MGTRIEITVNTTDYTKPNKEQYENDLIISLARFGYSPYFTLDDDGIAFVVCEENTIKIKQGD